MFWGRWATTASARHKAGLHCDELAREIEHQGKTPRQRFRVATTCTLDNSARMIRRHG